MTGSKRITLENKLISAGRKHQFVVVEKKNTGFGCHIKGTVKLSENIFQTRPNYVFYMSLNLAGERDDIDSYLSSVELHPVLRELYAVEKSQPLTSENSSTNNTIDIYNLFLSHAQNTTSLEKSFYKSMSCSDLVRKYKENQDVVDEAKKEKVRGSFVTIEKISLLLDYIKAGDYVKKERVVPKPSVGVVSSEPTVKKLAIRIAESLSKGEFLDVSRCNINGSNVQTKDDVPLSAYRFSIPELKNCFFTPKIDRNEKSPTRGKKYVGPRSFLDWCSKNIPELVNLKDRVDEVMKDTLSSGSRNLKSRKQKLAEDRVAAHKEVAVKRGIPSVPM